MRTLIFFIFLLLLVSEFSADAKDNTGPTLVKMSMADAEKSFIQNNFQLLAAKYNINAADAATIQAKLYPNPNLSIDQGAYNKDNNKWFDISKSGQTSVSLQQVIILAGKRNKQINLSKINSQISTYQFYDLIRTLRYELHTSFYKLFYLRKSIGVYDKEIESLQSLIDAYTSQYKEGNVAFKELARLQALAFNLENEKIDLLKEAGEKQSTLILLTGDSLMNQVDPVLQPDEMQNINISNINYAQLIDSGLVNRFDLQAMNATVQLGETNLALQKSLRMPDVTLGLNWDRQGSYINNYNSVSLAFDLPFWNRNQGNIKIASYQIQESKLQQQQAELQVKSEIGNAYHQLLLTDDLYKKASSQFNGDYDKLLGGILKGYQNHTINLLEFIDYYNTYKDSNIEFNRLQYNRIDAIEILNTATGTTVIK